MPSSLIDSVASLNFADLKTLAESDLDWDENAELHNAILNRYELLVIEMGVTNVYFGTEAFWTRALGPDFDDDEEEPPNELVENVPDHVHQPESRNALNSSCPKPRETGRKRKLIPCDSTFEELKEISGHGACVIPIERPPSIARAVILGICLHEKDQSPEKRRLYDTVKRGDRKRCTKQKTLAIDLATRAGVKMVGPWGMEDYKHIQKAIPDPYRLTIYSKDHGIKNKIYQGPPDRPHPINIAIYDDRAVLIKSMPRFFKGHWCEYCGDGYDKKKDHSKICSAACEACGGLPPCPETKDHKFCLGCRKNCATRKCYENMCLSYTTSNRNGDDEILDLGCDSNNNSELEKSCDCHK